MKFFFNISIPVFSLVIPFFVVGQSIGTDWRFVANSDFRNVGPSVILMDISSIKKTGSKYRFWTESVSDRELEIQRSKFPSLQSEAKEKLNANYLTYGYMASPELLDKKVEQVAPPNPELKNDSFESLIAESKKEAKAVIILLAIQSELIANKSSLTPTARIYYEIDTVENTAQVLEFINENGVASDTKYKKTYIPPNSPLQTMSKIIEKITATPIKKEKPAIQPKTS